MSGEFWFWAWVCTWVMAASRFGWRATGHGSPLWYPVMVLIGLIFWPIDPDN